MGTTAHTSEKETPFECNYGGRARTEFLNYLKISPYIMLLQHYRRRYKCFPSQTEMAGRPIVDDDTKAIERT